MTYFVTTPTNDRARLIINESCTTNLVIAEMIAQTLAEHDHIVVRRIED